MHKIIKILYKKLTKSILESSTKHATWHLMHNLHTYINSRLIAIDECFFFYHAMIC